MTGDSRRFSGDSWCQGLRSIGMAATQTEPVSRSSAEIPTFDPLRIAEVQRRHELLAEYLHLRQLDALLLKRCANSSWLTCGGELQRPGGCEPMAALLATPDARVALTNNVDSPLLFDGPLNGLGFQLKERPWHEPCDRLCEEICRGRRVGCDLPHPGTELVDADLADFRRRLNNWEEPLLRELGRDLAHAVEATCRNCAEGATESELAGEVQHRLARHLIAAVRVQVLSDGRGERYRHWGFSDAPIRKFATVAVVGRRQGLHLGVARTFAFGQPPDRLLQSLHHAGLLLGTALYFSQAGWTISDVWSRVQRIYEKFGAADEWRLADQGELTGYEPCEQRVGPGVAQTLAAGHAVHWHPSVGPALLGESLLVQPQGQTLLTLTRQWPLMTVAIKGTPIELPGLLIREPETDWAVG